MQQASLKAAKKGGDLVILSPTGSGKTLGFLLPVLHMLEQDKAGVQAMVIVPSRELAIQIESVFRSMGTGFKVTCCYGGHSSKTETTSLEQPPALLVGTPGRIADHIRRGSFDTNSIRILVLDEFDKALEYGFQEEMSFIIKELKHLKQRILTSATKSLEIPAFTGIKTPTELNYLNDEMPEGLKVKIIRSASTDKLDSLFGLICKLGNAPTLIFCNHREAVERISELLRRKGLGHDVFHGGLEQDERQRALIKFRNGSHKWLVTTDLAARGLDIPEIQYVIHYQLPLTESAFVHRNGRTARMHAKGTSYLILDTDEHAPAYLKETPEIETLPAKNTLPPPSEWATIYITGGKKDKINKMDIVGFLLQKGKLLKEELGLIEVQDHCCYAAVNSKKVNSIIQIAKGEKIKKQSVKIELAR